MELFPFQKEAVRLAIDKFNGRALVALDMGLGKTPVAISVAVHFMSFPAVVICPASLRLNWAREIRMWSNAAPKDVNIILSKKDQISRSFKWTVLSYEQATSRIIELASINPQMVIVDESHYVKNREARRTKAVVALCREAPRCLLLSGTPLLNRPIELWCQLEALKFSLGSYWDYAKKYCGAYQGKFGWDVSGSTNSKELNERLISGCMIRQRKSEVLTQLPEKMRTRLSVGGLGRAPMGNALKILCQKAYGKFPESMPSAMNWLRSRNHEISDCIFSAYSELAVLKSEAAAEIALELLRSGRPLVIFAHHKAMIGALSQALSEAGVSFGTITGDTKLQDRQRCVDDFQSGKIKAAVLSITAASTGLTLTAATDMLITELPFSPGVALQAEDRIHRIGQESAVLIRYLCADGTLDEALWRIITRKQRTANQVLDGIMASEFEEAEHKELGSYWAVVEQVLSDIYVERDRAVTEQGAIFI